MKWIFGVFFSILFSLLWIGRPVFAMEDGAHRIDIKQEVMEYYDYYEEAAQINSLEQDILSINQTYGYSQRVSFQDLYTSLLEGNVEQVIYEVFEKFAQGLSRDILMNRDLLFRLFALVIIAAVFSNYSSILKTSYVGEQGFYITYLMISILLMQSFSMVYEISRETVCYLHDLMTCLIPAFCLSITLCSGLVTSQMVNTMFIGMLYLVEKVLLQGVLPAVRVYFLIILLNQINREDRFSKLAGLLKQGIEFVLKGIVTGIIGLNLMKSILVPVYDNAKYNVLQKGLSVIPGGNTLSGLSTILVGAGVLIKNCVGITLTLIFLVLGSVPLVKIFCFYVVYRVMLAMIQPISDKRVLSGLQGLADSTGILLRATATSIVLSVLSIAIVLLTTNVRLYMG